MTAAPFRVVAIALSLVTAPSISLQADEYVAHGHTFKISSISAAELERHVLTSILAPGINLLGPETHPVTQSWPIAPCIQVMHGGPDDEAAVEGVGDAFKSRTGIDVDACASGDADGIYYYITSQPNDPDEKLALARLINPAEAPSKELLKFINGESDCYWRAKSSGDGKLDIVKAMVAANTSSMDRSQLHRCLFLGTAISLGVSNPFALLTNANVTNTTDVEWRHEEDVIFLASYILQAVDEDALRGDRGQLFGAVQTLLRRMHLEKNSNVE